MMTVYPGMQPAAMDLGGSPELRAVLLYLRPAPRRPLLAGLAGLGIFVSEHTEPDSALLAGLRSRADLLIAITANEAERVEMAASLSSALSSVLVAVVPVGASKQPYTEAGALAVVGDDEIAENFSVCIQAAARRAREQRLHGYADRTFVVLRDIVLRQHPPEMTRGGRTIGLTAAEAAVLSRLARTLGQPVPASDLERQVALAVGTRPRKPHLSRTVAQLKRKIERLGGDPTLLGTVRRLGYILIA